MVGLGDGAGPGVPYRGELAPCPRQEDDDLRPAGGPSVDGGRRDRRRPPPRPPAPGRRARSRPRCPCVRTTRRCPVPSAPRRRPPRAGAWGPCGRRPPGRAARAPADRADRPAPGPRRRPGCSPLTRRPRRWPAAMPARRQARTTTASGSRYAGSTQDVRSVAAQSPVGDLERGPGLDGGSPALHLAGGRRGPRPGSRPTPSLRRPSDTATSASAAAPCRRRTRPRPSATSGATVWCGAALERGPLAPRRPRDPGPRRRRLRRQDHVPRIEDRAPAGATAEVGQQRLLDRRMVGGRALRLRPSRRQMMPGVQNPHWLRADIAEGAGPPLARSLGKALDGGDGPSGHAAGGGHAGDAGLSVDEHRAAPALALGAAAVLRRAQPEVLAQHLQQRDAAVGHLDLVTIDLELEGARSPGGIAGRLGSPGCRTRFCLGCRVGTSSPAPASSPVPQRSAPAAVVTRRSPRPGRAAPRASTCWPSSSAAASSPPARRCGRRSGWPTHRGCS